MQTSERLCPPRAEKCRNGRAGSVLPSSMKAPTSAKSDVGWRFAPACCAAQSVLRARLRSAVQRSAPARCLGTSGVQNQFFGPRHRVGGAMRFLNQRLFRTSTPQESQLRSSSVARLMASKCQHLQIGSSVAVGTGITPRPPHRSVREELPHTAPTLGDGDSTSK